MNDPLVSIVTPTYNRRRYLPYAIESVLSQTYQFWEYIIIDDGSSDDTGSAIEPFLKDPRVKYFYQPNSGHAAAKNSGIKKSSGDFVCFLDSDNVWEPDKLSEQIGLFEHSESVDVIYGDITTIDRNGDVIDTRNMPRFSGQITEQLLRDNCVSINTSMTRRAAIDRIKGFDEELRRGDDYDFWLRLSVESRFYYHPAYWVKYRVMVDQISTDKEGRFKSNLDTIRRFFRNNPIYATTTRKRRAESTLFARRSRHRVLNGNRKGALVDALRAASLAPEHQAGWRVLALSLLPRRNQE